MNDKEVWEFLERVFKSASKQKRRLEKDFYIKLEVFKAIGHLRKEIDELKLRLVKYEPLKQPNK